jgi:hypothetical protein
MFNTCKNCSGALTRSILLGDQPSTSPLCAVCWYNIGHTLPLITLDELDELIDTVSSEEMSDTLIKGLQGAWVDWHGEIGVFTNTQGKLRIAVALSCARCNKNPKTFYFGSGIHSGAWPYAYDSEGNLLGNVRDQEFRCAECNKAN